MNTTTVFWNLRVSKEIKYSDLAEALVRIYFYNCSKVLTISALKEFIKTKKYLEYADDFVQELFPCEINEFSSKIKMATLNIKDESEFYKCLNLVIKEYESN